MRGRHGPADERGVSEIYGTFLIISLAFITAILLIGVGAFVFEEMQTETEDTLTEDSMLVLSDRIADISEGGTTEMTLPDAAGEVDANPDDATVNITMEAQTFTESYLAANDTVKSEEFNVGTIQLDAEDETVTAIQGGGLFQKEQGLTSVIEPPQLSYAEIPSDDGESPGYVLDLGFTDLTDATAIDGGDDLTIHADEAAAQERSNELMEQFGALWLVEHNQFGIVGTTQVDVTVEIESAFADGWAEYAQEGLAASPSDVTVADETVTVEFTDVGTPFPDVFESEPADWEEDSVIYAGNSSLAIYNDAIEPGAEDDGPGFVVNKDHGDVTDDDVYVAIYDKNQSEFVITDNAEDWYVPNPDEGGQYHSPEGEGEPLGHIDEDHLYSQTQLDPDEDFPEADEDAYDFEPSEYRYHFENPEAICVFQQDGEPGGEDSFPEDQEELVEACEDSFVGESSDPAAMIDGPNYEVEEWKPVEPVDNWDGVEINDSETIEIEATIRNTGDVPGTDDFMLKVDDRSDGITVGGETVEGMIVDSDEPEDAIAVNDTYETTFEWNATASDVEYLNDLWRHTGDTDLKLVTPDTVERQTVDIEELPDGPEIAFVDDKDNPDIVVNDTYDVNVEDGVLDAEILPGEDKIGVEVDVTNQGDAAGATWVTMQYQDAGGDNVTVASEMTDELESGDGDTISLDWEVDNSLQGQDVPLYLSTGYETLEPAEVGVFQGANYEVGFDETDPEVLHGDDLSVPVTVENTGTSMRTQDIELRYDSDGDGIPDEPLDVEEDFVLDGDEEESFELTWDAVGDGDEGVDVGSDGETVTIGVVSEDDVSVTELSITPLEIGNRLGEPKGNAGGVNHEADSFYTNNNFEDDDPGTLEDYVGESDVDTLVGYTHSPDGDDADWFVESYSFDWGDDGSLISDYVLDDLSLSLSHANLHDPGNLFGQEYRVTYQFEGLEGQHDILDHDEYAVNTRNFGDVSTTDDTASFSTDEDASSGDDYFALKITMELEIDDDGWETVDSDSLVTPMGEDW